MTVWLVTEFDLELAEYVITHVFGTEDEAMAYELLYPRAVVTRREIETLKVPIGVVLK